MRHHALNRRPAIQEERFARGDQLCGSAPDAPFGIGLAHTPLCQRTFPRAQQRGLRPAIGASQQACLLQSVQIAPDGGGADVEPIRQTPNANGLLVAHSLDDLATPLCGVNRLV